MLSANAAHRKDLSAKPASMTHQHYRAIAAIIRQMSTTRHMIWTTQDAERVAVHFANELSATNPNFNRARFLAACQPQEG